MRRRRILVVAALVFCVTAALSYWRGVESIPKTRSDDLIQYITLRTSQTDNPMQLNRLRHSGLRYAGPGDLVVKDNPDTITSFAPLDLSAESLVFTAPIPKDVIYWSVALFDDATNNYATFEAEDFSSDTAMLEICFDICGATSTDPEIQIESPTRTGVLIVRLVVMDRHDRDTVELVETMLRAANLQSVPNPT